MAERAEMPTNPDTLIAILTEVRATKELVDELEGRQLTMDGRLARQAEVLGEPAKTVPGAFPGDPPKVMPATGAVCAALDRLASADYQRTQASNKRSVLTSTGVALLVSLFVQVLQAWNGRPAEPPKPPPVTSPVTLGGAVK